MRTKVFILSGLALFSVSAFAQEGSKLNFGLKVAPTMAWFKPDVSGVASDGAKIGFAYGLMTDFSFTQNYAFGTGVDVTYRGGKLKSDVDSFDFKQNYTLQFIEVPLTLKLKTNEIGYMTYYGKFGFAPGINIKASRKTEVNGETTDESIKSQIQPVNLALIVGLGAQYSLGGRTSIMFGLTFNNGFLDLIKEKDVKVTSSFLALDLGIFF